MRAKARVFWLAVPPENGMPRGSKVSNCDSKPHHAAAAANSTTSSPQVSRR
jgi:hypothetical protein